MSKIPVVILCEGENEEAVLANFFAPLCQAVQLRVFSPAGASKLLSSYKQLTEAELLSNPQTRVFCLIDLKNIPFAFPRLLDADANPQTARYYYLKQHLENAIREDLRSRFFAFPVMMELETWVLADYQGLVHYLGAAFTPFNAPESLDDPAAELKKLVKRYRNDEYVKRARQVKQLFSHLDVQRVYDDSCPYFELIVNQLYQLQSITPPKQSQLSRPKFIDVSPEIATYQAQWESITREIEATQHAVLVESETTGEQLPAERWAEIDRQIADLEAQRHMIENKLANLLKKT